MFFFMVKPTSPPPGTSGYLAARQRVQQAAIRAVVAGALEPSDLTRFIDGPVNDSDLRLAKSALSDARVNRLAASWRLVLSLGVFPSIGRAFLASLKPVGPAHDLKTAVRDIQGRNCLAGSLKYAAENGQLTTEEANRIGADGLTKKAARAILNDELVPRARAAKVASDAARSKLHSLDSRYPVLAERARPHPGAFESDVDYSEAFRKTPGAPSDAVLRERFAAYHQWRPMHAATDALVGVVMELSHVHDIDGLKALGVEGIGHSSHAFEK
ncbi:MAG: hypothetical protein IPJ65_11410 [Archangiaceae bacterium]|nr:hypothetical protein [Archangiaceae bacterium]